MILRLPRSPVNRLRSAPSLCLALALGAVLAAPAAAQQENPCADPAYRQFDFWVGEWEVFRPDGTRAGHNTITRTMNGCVLHESYDGSGGYHGESFNSYDRGRGVWHQTWVDNGGLLLRIEGGIRDGSMVMEGVTVAPDGTGTANRITWTPLDEDTVRQHWETSADGGVTWETAFDGEYRRVGG